MYDLLVIGDDLASHVAAAFAAQNGLKTLLIDQSSLGGLHLLGDFVFNLDPMPLTGLGPGQLGSAILEQLEITLPEDHLACLRPAYQIILSEHRLDFSGDVSLLKDELAGEFPEFEQEISDFYDLLAEASAIFQNWLFAHPEIQPQNFREYIEYLKIYPDIFKYKYGVLAFEKILLQNASLEKVWEVQQALLSINLQDLFSFPSAFQYCAPLRGVSYFPSGKQFLFNSLITRLESKEGACLQHYSIESLKNHTIIELDLKGPDGKILHVEGQNAIISTRFAQMSHLWDKEQNCHMSERIRPTKILFYPFTLFLGAPAKCLPEQMARHIAVVPDVDKDLYDKNLIILETSFPEKDKPLASANTSLSATVYLPNDSECWTPEALQDEADSIVDRLEFFLPFLKENIALGDVDKSIDISKRYRSILQPKYSARTSLFTAFAAKSNQTRFSNIFFTGASLLPDAGFDAELISGRNAALQIIKKGDK